MHTPKNIACSFELLITFVGDSIIIITGWLSSNLLSLWYSFVPSFFFNVYNFFCPLNKHIVPDARKWYWFVGEFFLGVSHLFLHHLSTIIVSA
jgi:hypothetical protein